MAEVKRAERLQIMLMKSEITALDDWRYQRQMPSRAAAIRELLKRGLAADGFLTADRETRSGEFGVVDAEMNGARANGKAFDRRNKT